MLRDLYEPLSWARWAWQFGNPFAGAMGEAGLGGRVDTHTGPAFGQALLYTLLDAAGRAAARSTLIDFSSLGSAVLNNAERQRPTIRLDPSADFNVFVGRDLPLDRYAVNE